MKQQKRLHRLKERLNKLDKHIKENKKFGCVKTQKFRFNLQTRIINATMLAQAERRKQR